MEQLICSNTDSCTGDSKGCPHFGPHAKIEECGLSGCMAFGMEDAQCVPDVESANITGRELYENHYIALFEDGTIGYSDGVGYLGASDKDESYKLYLALKKYFEEVNNAANV